MYDSNIKRTVPYTRKIADNYKRQRKLMDLYNNYYFDVENNKERADRITKNANLLNGIVDEDDYNVQSDITMFGDTVPLGHFDITHYPHIARIAEAAVGEELLMPFDISVIDMTDGAKNDRKRTYAALIKEYLNVMYINPIAQSVLQQVDQNELAQLPPEQQQQVAQQIQQQIQVQTPKEIQDYMRFDYKSPAQVQGQKLMKILNRKLNLRQKKNQGFEHQYAYAEVYYLICENHDDVDFRVLNPKWVEYQPSPTSPWIQDAQYALYREQVTIQEAFALDGEYLEKKDIKKLASLVHGYETNVRAPGYTTTAADETVLMELHMDPSVLNKYGEVNPKTFDGHNKMINLYDEVLSGGQFERGNMYLTRTYIAWRDMAYYARVKRKNSKTGAYIWEWEAEGYVFNPERGDIKIKIVEKPEVWHGVVYGYGDDSVYTRIAPFPHQNKGPHDIHNPKLPFFGGKVNTRGGNATRNVSCVDLGKPWNYQFDLQMAELKLQQATNLGKVFVMLKEMKPENISWGEWMTTMKYLKVALLEGTKEDGDLPLNVAQLLRGVDMGTLQDIAGMVEMLRFTMSQIADSMYFSQERLGNIGQYMTAANSQQAVQASTIQTLRIYDTHLRIFEEACQFLLDVSRSIYKNNPSRASLIFNDMDLADLTIDWELLHRSELGVFVSISPADVRKVQEIKANTMAIIQNQMLDVEDLFDFALADTTGELKNLGHRVSVKRQEANAAAQQADQGKMQQMVMAEMEKLKMELENRLQVQEARSKGNLEVSIIDAEKFKNMMDVDSDNISDRHTTEMEKLKWEREKFELEMSLKEKDLEIKRLSLERQSQNKQNPK